jgi:hypothetical protein
VLGVEEATFSSERATLEQCGVHRGGKNTGVQVAVSVRYAATAESIAGAVNWGAALALSPPSPSSQNLKKRWNGTVCVCPQSSSAEMTQANDSS